MTAHDDRPGPLGWVLIALTAIVLAVAIVLTLNLTSRDALEPLPIVTASSF